MGLILVVDDDEMVRDFVTAILATFGHDSVSAGDGVEALLAFQYLRHQISLVIMDIMMPRMDGIAVTKLIKEANPSAKVILMTGCPEQFSAEVKPDAFLPKPFRSKDLRETVEKVLNMA
jgi:CheY-like chemotaxis protein